MTFRSAVKPLGRALPINWEMPLMTSNNQDGIVISGTDGNSYLAFDRNSNTISYIGRAAGWKWFNIKLPYKVVITKIECQQCHSGAKDDTRYNNMQFYNPDGKVISNVNINWPVWSWATTNVTSKILTDDFNIGVSGQTYFGVPEIRIYGYRVI